MTVTEIPAEDGWRFRWSSRHGAFELHWIPDRAAKGRWLRLFRPGGVGGWSEQFVDDLEHPETRDDAERIANEHADGGKL